MYYNNQQKQGKLKQYIMYWKWKRKNRNKNQWKENKRKKCIKYKK